MKELRGKLRKSVVYDNHKGNYQPNIMDCIHQAEKELKGIENVADLAKWKKEWFGE